MMKTRFMGQNRCYYLVSRLAHRAFFLDDEEKDRAVALMRRVEEFSGSAEFMRTFKQHFTMSFNGRREHRGTMFEGRYHERSYTAERTAVWRTSAYIDINAWKAGTAEHTEDYRWCSFAAAVHGDGKARAGYGFMYGGGEWRILRECHEKSMREAMGDVLKTRGSENGERPSDCGAGPVDSKACPRLDMPGEVGIGLARGREKTAKKILTLMLSSGTATPAPKGSVSERRNLRLKLALQAQTKTAIIPTTSKKASSAQGYATSVALATGWRALKNAIMHL